MVDPAAAGNTVDNPVPVEPPDPEEVVVALLVVEVAVVLVVVPAVP